MESRGDARETLCKEVVNGDRKGFKVGDTSLTLSNSLKLDSTNRKAKTPELECEDPVMTQGETTSGTRGAHA
eukprot:1158781-Pelagomonas_calceolata.AAC.9